MNQAIPTTRKTETIDLGEGRSVEVRKIRRVDQRKIATVVGLDSKFASQLYLTELSVRWAIVGWQGLCDVDTDELIPQKAVKHGSLGMIANEEVYNSLTDDEIEKLSDFIVGETPAESGEELTDAQSGN